MEKTTQTEPSNGMESSPKHSGYGTDKIGGKGQADFTAGVRELERQGKEFHHEVDKPGKGNVSNMKHEEYRKGHGADHFDHKRKR